jgi:hypothetical protein
MLYGHRGVTSEEKKRKTISMSEQLGIVAEERDKGSELCIGIGVVLCQTTTGDCLPQVRPTSFPPVLIVQAILIL